MTLFMASFSVRPSNVCKLGQNRISHTFTFSLEHLYNISAVASINSSFVWRNLLQKSNMLQLPFSLCLLPPAICLIFRCCKCGLSSSGLVTSNFILRASARLKINSLDNEPSKCRCSSVFGSNLANSLIVVVVFFVVPAIISCLFYL